MPAGNSGIFAQSATFTSSAALYTANQCVGVPQKISFGVKFGTVLVLSTAIMSILEAAIAAGENPYNLEIFNAAPVFADAAPFLLAPADVNKHLLTLPMPGLVDYGTLVKGRSDGLGILLNVPEGGDCWGVLTTPAGFQGVNGVLHQIDLGGLWS